MSRRQETCTYLTAQVFLHICADVKICTFTHHGGDGALGSSVRRSTSGAFGDRSGDSVRRLQLGQLVERAGDSHLVGAEVHGHCSALDTHDATESVGIVCDAVTEGELLDQGLRFGTEGAAVEVSTLGGGS
jgi:hypothetical protein